MEEELLLACELIPDQYSRGKAQIFSQLPTPNLWQ